MATDNDKDYLFVTDLSADGQNSTTYRIYILTNFTDDTHPLIGLDMT